MSTLAVVTVALVMANAVKARDPWQQPFHQKSIGNMPIGSEARRLPANIIFDTDMGGDCDDVGALFILHGAVERGEARLLATMGCTSSDAIAPCIDAINTWFGRPEIPVGTLKDPGFLPNPGYPGEIIKRFPHKFTTGRDYPDAVPLYREILAKQPDGSVVVVAVGPLRNLANLRNSARSRCQSTSNSFGLARRFSCLLQPTSRTGANRGCPIPPPSMTKAESASSSARAIPSRQPPPSLIPSQ
jgi:hypothetical protein